MKICGLGWPWSWLYNIAGRLGGKRKVSAIGVIGCADGPTSIFVARKCPSGKNRNRCPLSLNIGKSELFAAGALIVSLALVVFAALVSVAAHHNCGRRR